MDEIYRFLSILENWNKIGIFICINGIIKDYVIKQLGSLT